jgi:hypothetical protein
VAAETAQLKQETSELALYALTSVINLNPTVMAEMFADPLVHLMTELFAGGMACSATTIRRKIAWRRC